MPSLPGDVLLLAVTDRARYCTRGTVSTVLAGALLCSEALARDPMPAAPASRVSTKDLVRLLRGRAVSAIDEVSGPLRHGGVLAPLEHNVLGLFPRRGFVTRDPLARWQAEQRLLAAITPGARPDPGTAALAVLCAVSGIARSVKPPPPRRADRKVLAAHLNGLSAIVGPAVAEVLAQRGLPTGAAVAMTEASFHPAEVTATATAAERAAREEAVETVAETDAEGLGDHGRFPHVTASPWWKRP